MPVAVTPRVFHLATTSLAPGLADFLDHIGAGDWTTDATDDHSALVEVAGRSCYRSFGVGLNANVTRVREGNANYIGNSILGQKHGSVLEHPTDTFALVGVSRILTHEVVRHRQGTAFSQESGRYVRIQNLQYYYPDALRDDFLEEVYEDLVRTEAGQTALNYMSFEDWSGEVRAAFEDAMGESERQAVGLEDMLGLDALSNFGLKKKLQSSIRRVAPNGQANTIIVTANHRAWRHMIAVRTAAGAEEEIRLVFWNIYNQLFDLHPSIYQDAIQETSPEAMPSHIPVVSFLNEKV